MGIKTIKKVLIANRGEIVHRVAKTLRKLKIKAVGVCIPDENGAGFLDLCDEVIVFKRNDLSAFLDIDQFIEIAKSSGADAIHPGYGFLSENPHFARACEQNNIIFIGPRSESIELMGNKHQAKEFAKRNNIPVLQTVVEKTENDSNFISLIRKLSIPIILKPLSGGGGKGMTTIRAFSNIQADVEQARAIAKKTFSDSRLLAEPLIENAVHLEVQVIGDQFGEVRHLFERDCTIQRRHQKMIEESPSAIVEKQILEKVYLNATTLAKNCQYQSLGTVEFILDQNHNHYFMEMNTRLQVEHPVTEMTLGIDLVEKQIQIASGRKLNQILPKTFRRKKHAIEVRIYTENPAQDFIPSTGTIERLHLPKEAKYVRIDCGVENGTRIHHLFDPMIAKITVAENSRHQTLETLLRTLQQTAMFGVHTNSNYLQWVLHHKDFMDSRHFTTWSQTTLPEFKNYSNDTDLTNIVIASYDLEKNRQTNDWYNDPWLKLADQNPQVEWKKDQFKFTDDRGGHTGYVWDDSGHYWISIDGWTQILTKESEYFETSEESSSNVVKAPMTGTIIKVHAQEGGKTTKGDLLIEMEAMKMQYKILSPRDATISKVLCSEKEIVEYEIALIELSNV